MQSSKLQYNFAQAADKDKLLINQERKTQRLEIETDRQSERDRQTERDRERESASSPRESGSQLTMNYSMQKVKNKCFL